MIQITVTVMIEGILKTAGVSFYFYFFVNFGITHCSFRRSNKRIGEYLLSFPNLKTLFINTIESYTESLKSNCILAKNSGNFSS